MRLIVPHPDHQLLHVLYIGYVTLCCHYLPIQARLLEFWCQDTELQVCEAATPPGVATKLLTSIVVACPKSILQTCLVFPQPRSRAESLPSSLPAGQQAAAVS